MNTIKSNETEKLLTEIHKLYQQIDKLQKINADLEKNLENMGIYKEILQNKLEQSQQQIKTLIIAYQQQQISFESIIEIMANQNHDLEILLRVKVEHSNIIERDLYAVNKQLQSKIKQHQEKTEKMAELLKKMTGGKEDLEIILHTNIEHGDAIEAEGYNRVIAADLLANIDGLTQIANRRKFNEYFTCQCQKAIADQLPILLILCDIDYFKLYNDTYGHSVGDICLKQVATIIAHVVIRPADLVARYGGEEFAIILSNTPNQGALRVSELIRQAVENFKITHSKSLVSQYVTLSLGVTTIIPKENFKPVTLINIADAALYKAKDKGRNCSIYLGGNYD